MGLTKDHAVAGTAGVSVSMMLATVIQNWQGCTADVANAEAGLVVLGLGALYGVGRALLAKRLGLPTEQPAA